MNVQCRADAALLGDEEGHVEPKNHTVFLSLCSETKTLWIQNGIWDQLGINLEDATLQNTLAAKYSVISVLVHP